MNNISSYVDELLNQTAHMSSYEAESFAINGIENLGSGMDRENIAQVVRGRMALRPTGSPGSKVTIAGNSSARLAAEVNIKIDRKTAAINEALVVPLFGMMESVSGYQTILKTFNPLINSIDVDFGHRDNIAAPENVTLTFTQGADVDIVVISCRTFPYVGLVQGTTTGILDLSSIQYELSDNTQKQQFKELFKLTRRSMFGSKREDDVPVYVDPQQNQEGVVLVEANLRIDRETTVLLGIRPVADFQVNLGCFITQFSK